MTLHYKNISIHYTDIGEGTPLVFLHGFLENSTIWEPFLKPLSQKNRIICIDLLGHGKTGCLGYIHTMEAMADAVFAVLKKLNIETFAVFGHSMGGYVSLVVAEKAPNKVKGLGLINSTAYTDSAEKKTNRDRAILAVKENHKMFIAVAIPNLFAEHNREKYRNKIEHLKNEALKIPVQGIVAALEGMKTRLDRTATLHSKAYKKMLIVGKKDPVLIYDLALEQVTNTDVKLIDFPDGHMSYIENKDQFLKAIKTFSEDL